MSRVRRLLPYAFLLLCLSCCKEEEIQSVDTHFAEDGSSDLSVRFLVDGAVDRNNIGRAGVQLSTGEELISKIEACGGKVKFYKAETASDQETSSSSTPSTEAPASDTASSDPSLDDIFTQAQASNQGYESSSAYDYTPAPTPAADEKPLYSTIDARFSFEDAADFNSSMQCLEHESEVSTLPTVIFQKNDNLFGTTYILTITSSVGGPLSESQDIYKNLTISMPANIVGVKNQSDPLLRGYSITHTDDKSIQINGNYDKVFIEDAATCGLEINLKTHDFVGTPSKAQQDCVGEAIAKDMAKGTNAKFVITANKGKIDLTIIIAIVAALLSANVIGIVVRKKRDKSDS